jgi:hypothetical protein
MNEIPCGDIWNEVKNMEWSHRTSWAAEDVAFAPKRRVQNRGSNKRPHVIGAFYSAKMDRIIEYESLNEYLFLGILELDPRTARYYVQPVAIPVPVGSDSEGEATWPHVVDVLVFRDGHRPCLYDIKSPDDPAAAKAIARTRPSCERYAAVRGWGYEVAYPRQMPLIVAKNVKRLLAFTRPRSGTPEWEAVILARAAQSEPCTIAELAVAGEPRLSAGHLLPVVYHLIARGQLAVDLHQLIDSATVVRLPQADDTREGWMGWR